LTLADLGRFDEAEQALRLAEQCSGGLPWVRGWLAWGLGRSGKKGEAFQILTQLVDAAHSSYIPPTAIGISYLGLGQNDQALTWFDKAIEARDPFIVPLKVWPIFDPIRESPLYSSLLRKMNMSE
jgi:tetratricopeptide (TPR) repeat protein